MNNKCLVLSIIMGVFAMPVLLSGCGDSSGGGDRAMIAGTYPTINGGDPTGDVTFTVEGGAGSSTIKNDGPTYMVGVNHVGAYTVSYNVPGCTAQGGSTSTVNVSKIADHPLNLAPDPDHPLDPPKDWQYVFHADSALTFNCPSQLKQTSTSVSHDVKVNKNAVMKPYFIAVSAHEVLVQQLGSHGVPATMKLINSQVQSSHSVSLPLQEAVHSSSKQLTSLSYWLTFTPSSMTVMNVAKQTAVLYHLSDTLDLKDYEYQNIAYNADSHIAYLIGVRRSSVDTSANSLPQISEVRIINFNPSNIQVATLMVDFPQLAHTSFDVAKQPHSIVASQDGDITALSSTGEVYQYGYETHAWGLVRLPSHDMHVHALYSY